MSPNNVPKIDLSTLGTDKALATKAASVSKLHYYRGPLVLHILVPATVELGTDEGFSPGSKG